MEVSLSPKTEKLLQERMRDGDYGSPDEAIQIALESMAPESLESLDADTLAAINRAEQQSERGEGIPIGEAFAGLRRKRLGLS
ncbi:MAG TPA: hypothetical protein VFE47_12710 [Tepidisphaeraceae bacterium]|jgi:Arc/MetJ-type ribon-helix-helix transcriptional regulator|nr:hypothetical protein [Tepidisphaeraceae bacterium]